MKTKLITSTYSLMAGIALAIPSLHAATVYTPTGATSSLGSLSNRPIGDAIDGSGLTTGAASILDETHDTASNNSGPYFLGAIGSVLTFDLGASQTVDTVWIWSYTRTGEQDRGIAGFEIAFSNDDVTYGATQAVTAFDVVPYVGGDQRVDVQARSFTSQSGRYIQLTNVGNHGDGGYTGFGEIRFGEATPVPEPSTTALLGLGGLALILRRRK